MNCFEVQNTLEALATDPGRGLDLQEVHAIHFACAVIRSLPQNLKDCIDIILDLEKARPQQ
jgi:hypothetical protein